MPTALDYSAGRLSAATIKAAGHVGVIRYIGTPGRGKNITRAEYLDLTRNGVGVALVYENRAGDANGGFSAGVSAGRAARADADSIGWPRDRPIHFAIDSDQVTSLDFDRVAHYLDGAASILGDMAQVGVYGEFDVIERNVGSHARYGWQTVAWSGGRISKKAALYQRLGQIYVGGIQVDVNSILAADWGQHNAQEDDMPLNDADKATIAQIVRDTVLALLNERVPPLVRDTVRFKVLATGHDPDNPDASTPDVWTFGGRNPMDILLDTRNHAEAVEVKVDAKDPGVTLEAVKATVSEAVAQNIQITGDVHIGPAGAQ